MSRLRKHDPATISSTAPSSPLPMMGGQLRPPTHVFISYRRHDTAAAATHLHASLAQRFGAAKIFRDVVTLEPGQDYLPMIEQSIRATSVFIALIGRRWLSLRGVDGNRRLDDPKDVVRLEIETALRYGVTVIPVLVDGARMPTREDLPVSIADLAAHTAIELPWHEG